MLGELPCVKVQYPAHHHYLGVLSSFRIPAGCGVRSKCRWRERGRSGESGEVWGLAVSSQDRSEHPPPLQVGEVKVTACAQGTLRGSLKCHRGHVHNVPFT